MYYWSMSRTVTPATSRLPASAARKGPSNTATPCHFCRTERAPLTRWAVCMSYLEERRKVFRSQAFCARQGNVKFNVSMNAGGRLRPEAMGKGC